MSDLLVHVSAISCSGPITAAPVGTQAVQLPDSKAMADNGTMRYIVLWWEGGHCGNSFREIGIPEISVSIERYLKIM